MPNHVYISVIATVFNERNNIERLLESLADQTRRPDEVIICDGGSSDGTAEQIARYAQEKSERLPNLTLIVEPGANISRGRNLAIAAARGEIIAVTDAGVRLDARWLELLAAGFDKPPADAKSPGRVKSSTLGVAGFFLPDIEGVFQTAMAATVLPLKEDIDPARFLPSSRSVAFRKEAWQQIGGYPEWLDYCEDLVFDIKIQGAGGKGQGAAKLATVWQWAPDALVYFRPRENLLAFWKQYYRYARGDGKADLWLRRHIIRYVTYLVALPLLLAYGLFGASAQWLGWLGLVAGMLLYCLRPWQRLALLGKSLSPPQKFAAALLLPVIRVVGDVAKMVGYPVGLWWRWKNRRRKEIWWR